MLREGTCMVERSDETCIEESPGPTVMVGRPFGTWIVERLGTWIVERLGTVMVER